MTRCNKRKSAWRVGTLSLVVAVAWLGACDRKEAEPPEPAANRSQAATSRSPTPAQVAAASASATPEPVAAAEALRRPAPGRILALGDLHGDIEATRRALSLAGVLGPEDTWVGGNAVLVQTGDQLDRGDGEREIIELLRRLSALAPQSGGAVYPMTGNHEIMNVQGDYRYVTPGALDSFAELEPRSPLANQVPARFRPRAGAFLPGGAMALRFSERPVVLIVDKTLFAHGGVLPEHLAYGLDRLNAEVAQWMRGQRRAPDPILSPEGPVWTRAFAPRRVPRTTCQRLEEVLKRLAVDRLVVGHNVQKQGITPGCDGKVIRIDVGLAAYYGGPTEVLEIRGGETRILGR